MGKLTIGPEGFVDLRRNPPPETQTVNGWSPETDGAVPINQTEPVNVPAPKPESLPGRQKTTEGLARVEAPVRVEKKEEPSHLRRITAVDKPDVYAIVTVDQFKKLAKFEWHGTRSGHLYRYEGAKLIWLHRAACNCRADRFVGFKNGDQRLCTTGPHGNLVVVSNKEKAKEMKMAALKRVARK